MGYIQTNRGKIQLSKVEYHFYLDQIYKPGDHLEHPECFWGKPNPADLTKPAAHIKSALGDYSEWFSLPDEYDSLKTLLKESHSPAWAKEAIQKIDEFLANNKL